VWGSDRVLQNARRHRYDGADDRFAKRRTEPSLREPLLVDSVSSACAASASTRSTVRFCKIS
jgi:hypothetical protein